jgi:hypothetical protein|tara:strand:+ start:419 stop:673 length:255 start_codon:yes stop_codon:yes gene_type:complete
MKITAEELIARINIEEQIYAYAISKSSALIQYADKVSSQTKSYEMWGEYTDNWVLIEDLWKISKRELIVLKEFGNTSIEELNDD